MSATATTQVLDTSIDNAGLSIVTATASATAPRQGVVYNPLTLAAAVPVWFHPVSGTSWLMLMTKRWSAATVGVGGPQSYRAHTETTTPSWVIIDAASGAAQAPVVIPSEMPGPRVLKGAATRSTYLFTIGTANGVAHLAHYFTGPNGQVTIQGEELIPVVNGVNFSSGVYFDGNYAVVIGTDVSGQVYLARKNWGGVGDNTSGNKPWTYKSAKGWVSDPTALAPLSGVTATSGAVISYGSVGDREYLGVQNGASTYVYSSRRVSPDWTLDTTITGGATWLQNQLYYNPAILPSGHTSAIPYVTTATVTATNANALAVAWGLHAV